MPDLHGLRVYDEYGNIRLDTNDRQARLVMSYYSTNLTMPGSHDIIVPGISATDPTWALTVSIAQYTGIAVGNSAVWIPETGVVRVASTLAAGGNNFALAFEVYRI